MLLEKLKWAGEKYRTHPDTGNPAFPAHPYRITQRRRHVSEVVFNDTRSLLHR